MKHYLFLFIVFFLAQHGFGQEKLLNINALQDSVYKHPKPTMLLIHTDWCTYCALQKQQVSNKVVYEEVYLAEFNAEYKEEVTFNGQVYHYKPNGKNTGVHQLVEKLTKGKKASYPLWVILDEELNVLDSYAGYLRPEELRLVTESLSK